MTASMVNAKEPSVMPTIEIETDQLLRAALQMPEEELQRFVARLLTLKARQKTPTLSERESELLIKINQGLPPADARLMKELIVRRQSTPSLKVSFRN